MTAPRLEINLAAIESNTRHLVGSLKPRGIGLTAVTKAVLGAPEIGAAMLRGGASGIADSRIENLARQAPLHAARMLIRSPMLSQVDHVVKSADTSLNTGLPVLEALDRAARQQFRTHNVILMVELGDLREGLSIADVRGVARRVQVLRRLRLAGLGTNLACQNGVVPTDGNMSELSRLVESVEADLGTTLDVVSGGNSANLPWALSTSDTGRINNLRVGEAILLGTEPLHRTVIPGLHADAFRLVAEVIETGIKPSQPWGDRGQAAYGPVVPAQRERSTTTRQAILAIGRQDVELASLMPAPGLEILGMSSDHLVIDQGDHHLGVGDEVSFGLGYGALVAAMTSPFVAKRFSETRAEVPLVERRITRGGHLRLGAGGFPQHPHQPEEPRL